MGAVSDIRIKSPYKILQVEDITIENKPNNHGYLYLKCLIDDSFQCNTTINADSEDKIYVYEETDDNNLLFCGIIKTINTTKYDNDYYLEIEAITFSGMLDTEVKSRSFQNIEMTYEGLVKEVITDYVPYDFVFSSKVA